MSDSEPKSHAPNRPEEFAGFHEFWPFYLGEHLDPMNRLLHVTGTVLVVLLTTFAVVGGLIWTWPFWLLIAAPIVGYGFAWVGHFAVEKNRPASFGNPMWSLVADFRMAWFSLTGGLRKEAARVGARCRFN